MTNQNEQRNILAETFGTQKRWVNWHKDTKIPYSINGRNASPTDPSTWSTYEDVVKVSPNIGIMFADDKLLLGIDIDHCLETGAVVHKEKDKIIQLIKEANTHTEISPSGTGLHLFLALTSPFELIAKRKGSFETYNTGRYFTVTNNPYGETLPVRIVTPDEAIALLSIIGYPWGKKETQQSPIAPNLTLLDDETVLSKMFASKNGTKIRSLYDGDVSEHGNDVSSADLALCAHLAFWTGRNPDQIERIWLNSSLGVREKIRTRKDYRDKTISKAIEGCQDSYNKKFGEVILEEAPWNLPSPDNSIETIEEMLNQIPSETPKVKIIEAVTPILQKLVKIDKIVAETFILDNIKEHFGITKEDAKKYVKRLNNLKLDFIKKTREKAAEDQLPLIDDRDIDFREAYAAVSEIGIVNEETFKIVTAVIISAQLRLNPPLWLFLIGVPSSFKTEFVGLFSLIKPIFTLDTLTENAFASGYVPPDGSETQDLLPLLDNCAFIIKDLNTLFSMNEEMVKKILGDLTSIFDGKFQKFTATRGMISYNALFSMIGCITPSILIKHYNYATQLGPRFFFLRLPELTKDEMQTGFDRSWNETGRKKKIVKTQQIVSSYCSQLITRIKECGNITETKEIQEKINCVAQFICKARGIALTKKSEFKNDKGKEIQFYEITDWQVEQPWRILNQLKSLLKILAFINLKTVVGEEEINMIKSIILSTMPVNRAEVLNILTVKCGVSVKEMSRRIRKSTKTIQRTIKELEALEIIDCYKDTKYCHSGNPPWLHFIRKEFASILNAPIPTPESLSQSRSILKETEFEDEEAAEEDMEAFSEYYETSPK